MKSKIFYSSVYKKIQEEVKHLLNKQKDFLSPTTAQSTRAVGAAIQELLGNNFQEILGKHCDEYSSKFARRSMADFAFTDIEGFYNIIDVKTHREDTKFNMPNLTSVRRITKFYEDDSNYFVLLMVKYTIDGVRTIISDVIFVPIEFLGWDCLTLGALGWGQIQIANSNNISINPKYSRTKWMLELCDTVLEFYPKEILKINDRVKYFEKVRSYWLSKDRNPENI